MADFSLLLEAEKRGILPAEKVPLLAEARKRGMIPTPVPEKIVDPGANVGEIDPSRAPISPYAFEGYPGYPSAAELPQTGLPPGMLPAAGSLLAGGATLALTKNPTAAYMANVAGASGGSMLEDFLSGQPADEEMAKRALSSGIFAGLAPGVGAVAERLAMPGGKGIAQEATRAVQFARERSLPIDIHEVKPSWVTSLFSGDIFAAGRYKVKQYAKTSNDYLIGVRSKILQDLTGAEETASIPIGAVKGKIAPALKLKTTEAYEAPLKIAGDVDALVRLEDMRRTAGQMLQDARIQNARSVQVKGLGRTDPKEYLENFLKNTESGSAKFSDIHKIQSQINRVFYGATNEGGAPLLESLASDLVKWDAEVGKRLNEAYSIARTSAKNEFLFDTVYSVLRKATKVNQESGAEMLNGQLLKSALTTPMKVGKRYNVVAEKEILEKIGKVEGQKVLDDLYSVADYAMSTRGLRAKEGMKLFDPTTLISGGAGPAAGSFLNVAGPVAGIAVPQGTSLALTVALTGPGGKGFLRNFLLAPGHPTLKLGTRLGTQIGAEQMK